MSIYLRYKGTKNNRNIKIIHVKNIGKFSVFGSFLLHL